MNILRDEYRAASETSSGGRRFRYKRPRVQVMAFDFVGATSINSELYSKKLNFDTSLTTDFTIFYSKAYDSRKCEFKAGKKDYVLDPITGTYGPGIFKPSGVITDVSDAIKNIEYLAENSAPILDISAYSSDPTVEDYMRGIDGGIHIQLNDASDADPNNHVALGCCTLRRVNERKATKFVLDPVWFTPTPTPP